MSESYEALGICPALAKCCHRVGWQKPLPIQKSAIPPALRGKDIIGSSETGSGKTAAFLLPLLQNWLNAGKPTGFALLLAPTRELACQIAETANNIMAHFCGKDEEAPHNPLNVFQLIGGENSVEQALSLAWCRHHIIVATPGRLVEHMKQSPGFAEHHLSTVKQLVLDEADRMLSMEFAEDIDALLSVFEKPETLLAPTKHLNRAKKQTFLEKRHDEIMATQGDGDVRQKERTVYAHKGAKYAHPQTYLFTATMSKDVTKLRRAALDRDAAICTAALVPSENAGVAPDALATELPAGLKHFCLPTKRTDKLATLDWVVERALQEKASEQDFRIIVFCARCHETRYLAGFLGERGHSAVGLTGRMRQSERRRVLAEFVEGKARILVATDVASRGLDLPLVAMVINYGVPLTAKTYRHRVGRTARAGRAGTAVTILTRDEGKAYLELESALLPVKRKEARKIIPRWPHALPPEVESKKSVQLGSMSVRRRLADEAWSRAAKTLREVEARRLEERRANDLLSSSSEDDDDDVMNDDADDLEELSKEAAEGHWASGVAGIEAARQAHARDAAARRNRKRASVEEEREEGEQSSAEDDDGDDMGNMKFNQPIKEKRAAISAAKKKAAELKKKRRRKT